jgi:hypothetical protein
MLIHCLLFQVMLSEIYIRRLNDQRSVISKQRTAPQTLQLVGIYLYLFILCLFDGV